MSPRPKKPSEKLLNPLLEAINFLSIIMKEQGQPYETHILLQNNKATAYNDFLSAGCITNLEIWAAPYAKTLAIALSKADNNYALTVEGQKLILKSGKFKASISCIDPNLLVSKWPDNPCATIDDGFREALECMDLIKPEINAQKVHLLAFLLNGPSVISTDGKVLIEYWHGLNMPTLAIPKGIIAPILQNKKKLTQFGFSNNSCTFFFEDNSWIKSQLYVDQWPLANTQAILNQPSNPQTIPPDFYKALSAVSPFSPNGTLHFREGLLCSHSLPDVGATHEVTGLPNGPIYSIKYLSMVRDYIEKVDFTVDGNKMCYFFGNKCRGVIAGHG